MKPARETTTRRTIDHAENPIPESHAGPRGEPQSSPVWFGWDGKYVMFSRTETRQKCRNIQREPRLAIVDPENPLRYLEITGTIERIEEDPDLESINSMSKKCLGKVRYPNHRPGDERVVVFVSPEHTTKKDG